MLYLLFKQHKDVFFTLPSGDRVYWGSSVRYVNRHHRMIDRFQFFPKYNFFNAFKPQGFVSFGFKHFDRRVVSLVASKKTLPAVFRVLPQLVHFANLAPAVKVLYNPFATDFMASAVYVTTTEKNPQNLVALLPELAFNFRSQEALNALLTHAVSPALLVNHS